MVQDLESIVIDNSMQQSESEVQLVDPPEQLFDANEWAIVPYQPPVIQYDRIVIASVKVVYGPVLPPE